MPAQHSVHTIQSDSKVWPYPRLIGYTRLFLAYQKILYDMLSLCDSVMLAVVWDIIITCYDMSIQF